MHLAKRKRWMQCTNQKSLIFRIYIIQKDSSMQPLLLNLRILGQDFAHISYNILPKKEKKIIIYWKHENKQLIKNWNWKYRRQFLLTLILWASRWLIAKCVLIRQWLFWLRFLTTFTVNLWFGIWTASRSSPLTIVGDHQPTCCTT